MYKYLIISVAIMSIGGAGYYINKAGGGELIGNAITGDVQINTEPPTLDGVTGVYICNTDSGCNKKYVLILKSDQTTELSLMNDSPSEIITPTEDTPTPIERNSIIVNNTITPTSEITQTSITNENISSSTDTTSSTTPSDTTESVSSQNIQQEDSSSLVNTSSNEEISDSSILLTEKGNWNLSVQNMLVINLLESGTTTYDIPQKLVIKNVGASTLSKISYTKSNYKEMTSPVFVKQQ